MSSAFNDLMFCFASIFRLCASIAKQAKYDMDYMKVQAKVAGLLQACRTIVAASKNNLDNTNFTGSKVKKCSNMKAIFLISESGCDFIECSTSFRMPTRHEFHTLK